MLKMRKKLQSILLAAVMITEAMFGNGDIFVMAADTGQPKLEETGFTAMIGFQTSDYDCRESFYDNYYSIGQEYLSWLAKQDSTVDLSNVKTCNGRNIYYNGNVADANKKTLALRNPAKVELNKDAVATDVKMTKDGEYTVAINHLNLNTNPNGKEEADEIFNMLFVAADIPMADADGVEVKASSVKIDGEEVATDIVLPQNSDHKKYGQFMLADAYHPDAYESIGFGSKDGGNALTKIPEESIEITFRIFGVNWDLPKYQPAEIEFNPRKYRSVINYMDSVYKVCYFGESADETDVTATNAEVTGPGQYTVGLDFSQTEAGVGDGIAYMAVEVQDLAEYFHPDRYIRLDEIKINGKKVSDQILERAYTCSDDGKNTCVNLYNGWCPEDDAYAVDKYGERRRPEARAIGQLENTTPYLLEDYIDEEISNIKVTFTYGTLEEMEKIDHFVPIITPTLPPTQSPSDCPEFSSEPDRTPEVYQTEKPKDTPFPYVSLEPNNTLEPEDTPFPDETLEPHNTPKPEETELPGPTKKPDQNDFDDDLIDDMPNRDLKVRGLDIAADNIVKKGFLSVPRVQLTWDNNRRCDGYEIWKKVGNQSFIKVDYVDDSDETEWFDTDLKKGCKYTYIVLGYVEEDDGTISRAEDRNSVSVKIRSTVKSCTYTAKRTEKKLKIIFKKAEGTKYQIQVKYKKLQKWKKASGSLKKKIVKKVSPKKLKVRVRTCEKVNGKMKYSKWSKAKTVR